jgi:hypothetical protein
MLQVMFVAVTDLDEGLRFETLFALKVEKYVICLVGTRTLGVSITEQQLFLPSETLTRKKHREVSIWHKVF